MRTIKDINNRAEIEGKLEVYSCLLKYIKGYSIIRDIVNKKLKKENLTGISQDVVYRMLKKKHLPDEYVARIVLEACDEFYSSIVIEMNKISLALYRTQS